MRATSDGYGDGPWEESSLENSGDDEATRAFTRDDLVLEDPTSEEYGHTREFAREGIGEDPFVHPHDPSDQDRTTQVFARDDHLPPAGHGGAFAPHKGEDVEFTRRFVRQRLPGRGSLPRDSGPEMPDDVEGGSSWWETEPPAEPSPRKERAPRDQPRRMKKERRFRVRWVFAFVLIVVLLIPPATWGWVWYTARQDDRDPSDVIIVLGASQYNGVPSPVFEARLRQAQALYLDDVAPIIVTVGGKQPDDAFTEAEAGRNWLIDVGVPAEQVVAVEEGADTLQSIVAVSEVFDERSWETAILVSDPWHSLRAERMANDHGIDAGTSPARSGPSVIERSTQLWYITRETASLWYYWIFDDSSDINVNAA
ncbi:MAG TPA: YdcF family protein [Candidatus Nocardiopsis merdipullorum]|nr:YdcF family protein [Candidatus Nocardiopsis merdipullorum]